jgi:uncharacterized protein with von Willebrand factor type A (vWA) domain
MRSRYYRWDGSQDPLGEKVDVRAVLDEMSDELLSGYGPRWSLRELQRRGVTGRSGLDDMLRRVRQQRQKLAQDTDLSGPLRDVRRKLDEILSTERGALGERDDDDARMKEVMLDALPQHPAGAIRELTNYDFASPEAAQQFEALLESLREEVLNSYFRNLAGAMRNVTPEDLERLKDMLAELNDMIAADRRGDDYDFEGFMQRYGDFFPENPRTLQELLEAMARRMAAMSRLLASMSESQRRELADLAASVMEDMDLAWQVDQLNRSLRELMPSLPWDEASPNWGEAEMPMSAAVDAIERLGELDELEETMSGDYAGATLDDIDEDKVRRIMGDEALEDLQWLKEIERALEDAGIMRRRRGELELTPRGARMIGERSLTKVLERIRREPTHRARGGQAEPTGATRAWQFGDSDPISVERTVHNAVVRGGPGRELQLRPGDFEIIETESRPRTATALLLDLSMSMPLRGHWLPAKRMALALHALIDSKYPQDSLHLIGFSDYAHRMEPEELASSGWQEVQGTNMQHAFLLARRILGEDPRSIKQVIMVTDGEPTAHLEDGYAWFNWPPIPETIEKTLSEAMRLARSDISINVFMLERAPGLEAFMEKLAHLTGGSIYRADSDAIESTIIGRYIS